MTYKFEPEADLSYANLQEANLEGVNLNGADLRWANLQEGNLEGVNLKGANLRWANLQEANLEGVNLKGADLEDANLQEANLEGVNLKGADLSRANLQEVNLKGANLTGADLSSANLQEANFQEANLKGANLVGANLRGANFQEAGLQGARLIDGTNLQETNFEGANLKAAKLRHSSLEGANFQEAYLKGADLESANLQDANFQNANLQKAKLGWAKLRGASLKGANLEGAYLEQAVLQQTSFEDANLYGAELQYASIEDSDFTGANLKYAVLDGTDLAGTNLDEVSQKKKSKTNILDKDAIRADVLYKNVSRYRVRPADASHTLDQEAPVHLVQESLGHQSVQSTSRKTQTLPEDSISEDRNLTNSWKYQPDYKQQSAINPDDIWVPQGKAITVAGRKIRGMVYLGSRDDQDQETYGDAVIDKSLSVSRDEADIDGNSMPYWPSYSTIAPVARAAYLDWLSSDRSDSQYGLGYIFLYFYGLERRFFLDSPSDSEKKNIITEVERLLGVYGSCSYSVRKYMSVFLSVASTTMNPNQSIKPRFGVKEYRIPLEICIAIGRMLREGQPLSYDWSLCWYAAHPQTRFRTAAKRAFPEFKELFRQMFENSFPTGLEVPPPQSSLSPKYNAAAGTFTVDLTHFFEDIPDITCMFEPPEEIGKIVEQATESLDKYSRCLGRDMKGRDTIEAYTLLPESLRPLFPNTAIREFRSWVEDVVKSDNLVKIEEVVEKIDGASPEKIYKRHLTKASDVLACFSIGMEPDPRFSLRGPKLGETVVLFELPENASDMSEISEKYRNVLLRIMIGGFIAHADDSIAQKEKVGLEAIIESTSVSDIEQIRLLANLRWVLTAPPNLKWLKSCLKNTSENLRHDIGRIALSIAAIDGVIQPEEIKAIEELYKAIGLEPGSIYADLHTLTDPDEPRTILLPLEKEKGLAIPQPKKDQPIVLDADRINALISDTAQVSTLLSDIFNEEDLVEDLSQDTSSSDNIFEGLDSDHLALLHELLRQEFWNKSEYATLVSKFKLMPEGAIETLNEWAFDQFEDILIDEDERYELNTEIVTRLEGLSIIAQRITHTENQKI